MIKMCLVRCIQISTAVAIVSLLVALTIASGCRGFGGDAQSGASTPGSQQASERPQMNLSSAAATLGVTEDILRAALGDTAQGPGNLTAAAAQLGVSEEELMAALGIPKDGMGNRTMDGGQRVPVS